MSGCRIEKVKLKSGGVLHVLPTQDRLIFHDSVQNMSSFINDETHAVAFFIQRKDRSVISGISYGVGFALTDLTGACDYMKEELKERIWPTNQK